MKTCPRRCGMYSDVETKCPVCGARLYRVNTASSGNTSQTSTSGSTASSGTSHDQKASTSTTQTQQKNLINNKKQYSPKPVSQQSKPVSGQGGQPITTYNVNKMIRNVNSKGNEIQGKITNYREMRDSSGKMRRFFEGMANRGCISLDDNVTNFTVVEIDDNGNQTGVSRNVTFRGQVLGGNICDNDEVIVRGINDRNGSINATTIYNKSANCKVRLRAGIPWYAFILLFLLLALGVVFIATNISVIVSSVTGIAACIVSVYFAICVCRYIITGHFSKRGYRHRRW